MCVTGGIVTMDGVVASVVRIVYLVVDNSGGTVVVL